MTARLDITALGGLVGVLDQMLKVDKNQVGAVVRQGLRAGAHAVMNYARRFVPVDTGVLKRSLHVRRLKSLHRGEWGYIVKHDMMYFKTSFVPFKGRGDKRREMTQAEVGERIVKYQNKRYKGKTVAVAVSRNKISLWKLAGNKIGRKTIAQRHFYGGYVEYGTRTPIYRGAQPYMRLAAHNAQDEIKQIITRDVGEALRTMAAQYTSGRMATAAAG